MKFSTLLLLSTSYLASGQQIEEQAVFAEQLEARTNSNSAFSFIGNDAQQMMESKGLSNVNNVVIGLNDCMVETIKNNKIADETKQLMDFITSSEWISTVEDGTR